MMDDLYGALAPVYDRLNAEIDYGTWADFFEERFRRDFPAGVSSVLDLGCGTGRMTVELAKRGYDMIGVDLSEEMLDIARRAAERAGVADRILYLCQDMCEFELYGTVEAIVCCLDAVNHITDRAALSRCFHWVHNYLVPGGLFLFDLNTPHKFKNVYGDRAYILEDDGVLCAWQNDYREKRGLCDFYVTLFREGEDGRYTRVDEHQRERVYTLASVKRLLSENGMELIGVFGDTAGNPPKENCERWYVAARAIKGEMQ